jgi:hypothetical protein
MISFLSRTVDFFFFFLSLWNCAEHPLPSQLLNSPPTARCLTHHRCLEPVNVKATSWQASGVIAHANTGLIAHAYTDLIAHA